ncbi:tumor necrosis factor receptor superfamily member 11B-like isoform X1 [Scleropages formosus]|uniref:tumor necrosis factor receptor superfamily member 11B-like isoform X1 n=1 Tax=Scleropages formosus TaxID=113540 RepID=UPI000878CCBD|nr:tumor necrosis factor receptor superfamily member 11B-like isoform X1 [Scleropages formosus]
MHLHQGIFQSAFSSELFAVSLAWALREDPPPKYYHRDPANSEVYLCDQCPPGTAVRRHCGPDGPTLCDPCPEHHFSEQWHWGETCQYCTAVCKERQLVVRECNSTHDRLCECSQGYHLEVEFCVRHTACPPGQGAAILGTPESDTVCKRCPRGYFSSVVSATEPCLPHQNCSRLGLRTTRPGTATQDAVCETETGGTSSRCRADTTLCEEAIFQFLVSRRLCLVQPDLLLDSLSTRKVDGRSLERVKTMKLLQMWREQNKDQDRLFVQGVSHCEKKVSRFVGLRNLSLEDLVQVMESLPGVKVPQEEVHEVARACLFEQSLLQLLQLWKSRNEKLDIGRGLELSLRKLRGQDVPQPLLRALRKMSRIFNAASLHKMCEKMFVGKFQDSKCSQSKSFND